MMFLYVLACLLCGLFLLISLFLHKRFTYWERRGVVHDKPTFLYGNLREFGRTKPLVQPFRDFYMKYKNKAPFGGFYLFMRPAIVLFDLELVKDILIKDFGNFPHRGNYYNEKDDPLSGHLVNLAGPKWRTMRTKLTPTFTSGKMKFMFPTVVHVANEFVSVFKDLVEKEHKVNALAMDTQETVIEIKDLLARFTTDVIGTCAFGLECNSLKNPQTLFRRMGSKVFTEQRYGKIMNSILNAFPELGRKLHIKLTHDDVDEFFMRVVRETVEYREREGVQRNDFMNLLIELKKHNETEGFTIEDIAAQAFVFFLAGFETSSSTMGFCLYELALNQNVQDKARAEIQEMLDRYNGKFTYEGIRELKYLQQIFYETLRLYAIASFLLRKTIDDYPVPNTNHIIEKGTMIIVPVDAIHYDPDIYPNPTIFDPSRFDPEEVEKRHSMCWLPFGEGPRNCIGLRFGEMQAIIGLVMLLNNFKFTTSKQTQIPIQMNKKCYLLASDGGIYLNVEKL